MMLLANPGPEIINIHDRSKSKMNIYYTHIQCHMWVSLTQSQSTPGQLSQPVFKSFQVTYIRDKRVIH